MASEICAYVGKTKPWEFPVTFDFTINIPDGGVQMGTYKVTFEKLRQHKTVAGIRFYYSADGIIKATLHSRKIKRPSEWKVVNEADGSFTATKSIVTKNK